MAKHQNISSPYAVHPFAFSSNADPANDAAIDMAPYKGWINTGNSNLLKVRNAANGAWEDVSVAGAATAPAFGSNSASVTTYNDNAGTLAAASAHHHIGVTSLAHTSNTFTGAVILTAAGTLGITSPTPGTFQLSATGGAGGGSASNLSSAVYLRTSANYTTTSTSFVDVDATNLALTITTGARRCEVSFAGGCTGTVGYIRLDLLVDGVSVSGGVGVTIGQDSSATISHNMSFTYVTDVLTAASHTFKLQWATSSGTATLYGGQGGGPTARFAVVELYAV